MTWLSVLAADASDLSLVETLGITTGYLAVLVLALYINSDPMKELYFRAWPMLLICPLLMYWIARVWLHAKRRILMQDPIVFAFRDWVSLCIGCITLIRWVITSWPT